MELPYTKSSRSGFAKSGAFFIVRRVRRPLCRLVLYVKAVKAASHHRDINACPKSLECVSKRKIRKFEWILRQFKEETRRLSSAKSRVDDAEMAQKTPKLRIREFLRHTLKPDRQRLRTALTQIHIASRVQYVYTIIFFSLAGIFLYLWELFQGVRSP